MHLTIDDYIKLFYDPISPLPTMKPEIQPTFKITPKKASSGRCWASAIKHHYEALTGAYYPVETFIIEMKKLGYKCDELNLFYLKINKHLNDKHFNRLKSIFYNPSYQPLANR